MRVTTEIVDDELERVWIDTTPPGYCLHPSGLLVPATLVKAQGPPVGVDLFAGCGGFSLGMEAGGFDVAVAVDHWPVAGFTYTYNLGARGGRFVFTDAGAEESFRDEVAKMRKRSMKNGGLGLDAGPFPDEPTYFGFNRPKLAQGPDPEHELRGGAHLAGDGCRAFIIGDVCKLTGDFILESGGLRQGEVRIVFGGPPCQGFSMAGKQDPADPRNNLILEFLRLVIELDTPCFMMENVPPLITHKKYLPLWQEFKQRAHDGGFDLVADVLDACNYGVPQHRRRAIVVGTRKGMPRFQFPLPTHWGMVSPIDGEETDMIDIRGFDGVPDDDDLDAEDPQGSLW
jgi:DNA (cytosine-5)-methyltransferase 1